jgi:hypothetical protein
MKKVYLAGPMRGIPAFNAPAFKTAAEELRTKGYEVFCPAENSTKLFGDAIWKNQGGDEGEIGGDRMTIGRTVFHLDLTYICLRADMIALLPGWRNSKGATAEHAAAVALGLEVIEL